MSTCSCAPSGFTTILWRSRTRDGFQCWEQSRSSSSSPVNVLSRTSSVTSRSLSHQAALTIYIDLAATAVPRGSAASCAPRASHVSPWLARRHSCPKSAAVELQPPCGPSAPRDAAWLLRPPSIRHLRSETAVSIEREALLHPALRSRSPSRWDAPSPPPRFSLPAAALASGPPGRGAHEADPGFSSGASREFPPDPPLPPPYLPVPPPHRVGSDTASVVTSGRQLRGDTAAPYHCDSSQAPLTRARQPTCFDQENGKDDSLWLKPHPKGSRPEPKWLLISNSIFIFILIVKHTHIPTQTHKKTTHTHTHKLSRTDNWTCEMCTQLLMMTSPKATPGSTMTSWVNKCRKQKWVWWDPNASKTTKNNLPDRAMWSQYDSLRFEWATPAHMSLKLSCCASVWLLCAISGLLASFSSSIGVQLYSLKPLQLPLYCMSALELDRFCWSYRVVKLVAAFSIVFIAALFIMFFAEFSNMSVAAFSIVFVALSNTPLKDVPHIWFSSSRLVFAFASILRPAWSSLWRLRCHFQPPGTFRVRWQSQAPTIHHNLFTLLP